VASGHGQDLGTKASKLRHRRTSRLRADRLSHGERPPLLRSIADRVVGIV
jgi:hypothetical protein